MQLAIKQKQFIETKNLIHIDLYIRINFYPEHLK